VTAAPSDVPLSTPPASVVVHREVEWCDTDASGHHHHGAVIRWVEAAEAELLRRCGVGDLFGRIPRVHYEVDYRSRLWFGQQVQIELAVARLGRKSLRYEFVVRAGDVVAATGNMVVAMAAPDSPRAVAWPDDVRAALLGGASPAA
jgi:acyl-CoA thioester hydrolase